MLNRRGFLAGVASTTLLAACSSSAGGDGEVASVDPGPDYDDGTLWLQAGFADGFRAPATLAAGRAERAPFVFVNADGLPVVNGLPGEVDMVVTSPSGASETFTVGRRSVDIPSPYFPLVFSPETAGVYTVDVAIDGETQRVEFGVAEPEAVGLVVPGEPLRPVDTPTFDDARGFDPICTRFEPCPFHEITVTEAAGNGRPTVLLIATPGFCQTVICGPVLELLIDAAPADVDVIHAEVYNEPARINEIGIAEELLGPVITTYAMGFEPSIVVADADGIVTARLDYAWDASELADALATI